MATRFAFVDDSGETRLAGFLVPEPGGSLPVPFTSGDGPPIGVATPASIGAMYADTTNGALWVALGVTDADWRCVGGSDGDTNSGSGVFTTLAGGINVVAGSGGNAQMTGQGNGDGYKYDDNADNNRIFGASVQVPGVIFPSSDPHIAGAWWDNAGTLTRSTG